MDGIKKFFGLEKSSYTSIKNHRKKCKEKETKTCKITDEYIDIITFFLTNNVPKYKDLNIELRDIKKGKIINIGDFSYDFLAKDIVIKIILCDNYYHKKQLLIKYLKAKITEFTREYFISIIGYVNDNNYINVLKDDIDFTISDETNNILYLFFDSYKYTLNEYIVNTEFKQKNMINEFIKLTNNIYELLKFYTINENYLSSNNIFIHANITLDNIVYTNEKLKIFNKIVNNISNYWIRKVYVDGIIYSYYKETEMRKLTKYYAPNVPHYISYDENLSANLSPYYDIFSLIACYILCCHKIFNIETKDKYKYEDNIKNILNVYKDLASKNENIIINDTTNKMLRLFCIGWIFIYRKANEDITDSFDNPNFFLGMNIYENTDTNKYEDLIIDFKIINNDVEDIEAIYQNMNNVINEICKLNSDQLMNVCTKIGSLKQSFTNYLKYL